MALRRGCGSWACSAWGKGGIEGHLNAGCWFLQGSRLEDGVTGAWWGEETTQTQIEMGRSDWVHARKRKSKNN